MSVDAAPGFDFEGGTTTYTLQITASDSRFSVNKTITVTILDSPEPPHFSNIEVYDNTTVQVNENYVGWFFTAVGADQDAGSTFTYSVNSQSAFSMDSSTGELSMIICQCSCTFSWFRLQLSHTNFSHGSAMWTVLSPMLLITHLLSGLLT